MKKEYIMPLSEAVLLAAGNTILGNSIGQGNENTSGETEAPTRRYRPI